MTTNTDTPAAELKKLVAEALKQHVKFSTTEHCSVCGDYWPCDAVQLAHAVQVLAEALEDIVDVDGGTIMGQSGRIADAALTQAAGGSDE